MSTIAVKGTPLSTYKIPPYKYFPTNLMEKDGPKHWAQLRFLQACERLNIPQDQWPRFPHMLLPHAYGRSYKSSQQFTLPEFNVLYETEAEWKNLARQAFEKFMEDQAKVFRFYFREDLKAGKYTRIKLVREATPIETRYEWAALRYCARKQFKELETDQHSADTIRKSTDRILEEIGLKKRK